MHRGNDQYHFDLIGGNQGGNCGGNHNYRFVNPWERQYNDDISLYTNHDINYYSTQGCRNILTSCSGRGRVGEPNGSVNNIYSNICEPVCELNPK